MTTGVISWSKTAASNATADSAINYAEGMAPSAVNDSARAAMASTAKWRDDLNGSIVTTGGTLAYLATSNQGLALTAGYEIAFQINATNTGTTTLNVDSLGAKPLRPAAGVEFTAGALKIGSVYRATYFTSNSGEWIVHGQPFSFGPLTITGTFGVSGDFSVNTNKFTVAATTGNTVVAGTLGVTGAATLSSNLSVTGTLGVTSNFAVNTNKFTVAAASGNTVVAGTLDVTGLTTLSGGVSVSGALLTSSATGGIGYTTGAGGTVTQLTDKTTGVTLNKITGRITMAAGIINNLPTELWLHRLSDCS